MIRFAGDEGNIERGPAIKACLSRHIGGAGDAASWATEFDVWHSPASGSGLAHVYASERSRVVNRRQVAMCLPTHLPDKDHVIQQDSAMSVGDGYGVAQQRFPYRA